MENINTTIQLKTDTREELDSMKVHPRQTYNELIQNFIKKIKKITKK